jgi:hypothetical protein
MIEDSATPSTDDDIRAVVAGHDAERQGTVVRDQLAGPWGLPAAGYTAKIAVAVMGARHSSAERVAGLSDVIWSSI